MASQISGIIKWTIDWQFVKKLQNAVRHSGRRMLMKRFMMLSIPIELSLDAAGQTHAKLYVEALSLPAGVKKISIIASTLFEPQKQRVNHQFTLKNNTLWDEYSTFFKLSPYKFVDQPMYISMSFKVIGIELHSNATSTIIYFNNPLKTVYHTPKPGKFDQKWEFVSSVLKSMSTKLEFCHYDSKWFGDGRGDNIFMLSVQPSDENEWGIYLFAAVGGSYLKSVTFKYSISVKEEAIEHIVAAGATTVNKFYLSGSDRIGGVINSELISHSETLTFCVSIEILGCEINENVANMLWNEVQIKTIFEGKDYDELIALKAEISGTIKKCETMVQQMQQKHLKEKNGLIAKMEEMKAEQDYQKESWNIEKARLIQQLEALQKEKEREITALKHQHVTEKQRLTGKALSWQEELMKIRNGLEGGHKLVSDKVAQSRLIDELIELKERVSSLEEISRNYVDDNPGPKKKRKVSEMLNE